MNEQTSSDYKYLNEQIEVQREYDLMQLKSIRTFLSQADHQAVKLVTHFGEGVMFGNPCKSINIHVNPRKSTSMRIS